MQGAVGLDLSPLRLKVLSRLGLNIRPPNDAAHYHHANPGMDPAATCGVKLGCGPRLPCSAVWL